MVWLNKDDELKQLDPESQSGSIPKIDLSDINKQVTDRLKTEKEPLIKNNFENIPKIDLSDIKKEVSLKINQPKQRTGASGSWADTGSKNIDLSKDINKEELNQQELDKKTSISNEALMAQAMKLQDGILSIANAVSPTVQIINKADELRGQLIGEENNEYLKRSIKAGATQGILPNDLETDSNTLYAAGVIANGLGTIATGWLLPEVRVFKTLSSGQKIVSGLEKVAAPFFKQGTKEAIKKISGMGIKNLAKETVNTMATGAVYGGVTEGLKSFIYGEDGEDTLAATLQGFILGGAVGAVAGPLLEVAGKFVRRKQLGQLTSAIKVNLENKQIVDMVEKSADALNKGDVKAYVAANAQKFANKVKDINPVIMPWELVARPDLLLKENQGTIDNMVDNLFLKPGAPAAEIYNKSDHLKRLVESGKKVDALQQYSSMTRSQAKANQPLKEYLSEPYMLDANILPAFMADTLLSKKRYEGIGDEARTKLINYFDSPTPQNESDLMLVVDKSNKPIFKKAQSKRDLAATVNGNIRLNSEKVDDLISQQLTSMFNGFSNNKFGAKDVLSMTDFDGFLTSMTTLNKPLFRTVAESFVGSGNKSDMFVNVKPEDKTVVEKLIDRRVDREHLGWLVKNRFKLNEELKLAGEKGDSKEVLKLRDKLKINNRSIGDVQNRISANEAGINNQTIDPKELERLTGIADSIFIPRIDSINKKLPEDIKLKINEDESVRGTAIKNAVFKRDNPNLVKDMTDFSDLLQAMDYAGYDVDLGKVGSIFSGVTNIQRKAMAEFGLNSPFQKIFNLINDVEIKKNNFKNYWNKQLKLHNPDLKPGSKADRMLREYMEGKFQGQDLLGNIVENPEFKNLPARDQEALKKASLWMQDTLTEKILKNGQSKGDFTFESINNVLMRNGDAAISAKKVDAQGNPINYFPHYADEWSLAKAKFVSWLKGEPDPTRFAGISPDIPERGMLRKKASFEKARSGLTQAKGVKMMSAIESFQRYVSDAADIIYGTDLSKSIYAASNFAPYQIGQSLRDIADRYVVGLTDEASNSIVGKTLSEIRRRVANSVLLGSPGVAAQQLLSMPLNAAIGGKEAFTALYKRTTKEGKEAIKMSQNLALRDIKSEGFNFNSPLIRKGLRKLGRGGNVTASTIDMYEKFMSSALRIFDKEAATHAYLTGYQKGIKAGLNKQDAAKYGDYMVGLLHGQMTKIGQPQFMQSVYGRSLMQFQSFATNMFGTLKDDLGRIVADEGATKAFNYISKAYMNMTLTNEVLRENGLPPQFDMGSFFPMWEGNRGNIPGSAGVVANALNFMGNMFSGNYKERKKPKPGSYLGLQGTDPNSSEAVSRFENDLLNITGIPGSRSAIKWIKGNDKELKKEVASPWIGKIYGTKAKGYKKKDVIEKRNAFRNTILRKKIKEYLINFMFVKVRP